MGEDALSGGTLPLNRRAFDGRMQKSTSEQALSWAVTALTAGYIIWTGLTLTQRVSTFANLFSALGAELPYATRFAIDVCRPVVVWPLVAVTLIVLLANQLRTVRPQVRLTVAVVIFMAAAVLASLVTEAMFVPMVQLIRQIG